MWKPLRRAPGPSVTAAGALLSHAAGRLLRGHRQRAGPGVALRRQPVAARVPASRRAL
ncbi:MAG: putative transposase for insertion sequence element, partial [uncultured Nocardioidaceae bacterium]